MAGRYWEVNTKQVDAINAIMGIENPNVDLIQTPEQLTKLYGILVEDTNKELGHINYPTILTSLHEALVPHMGAAPTLVGELVRAVNRLAYRFVNDGDTIMDCDPYDDEYDEDNEDDYEEPSHCEIYETVQYLRDTFNEYAFNGALLADDPRTIIDHTTANDESYEDEVLDPLVDYILSVINKCPETCMNPQDDDCVTYVG